MKKKTNDIALENLEVLKDLNVHILDIASSIDEIGLEELMNQVYSIASEYCINPTFLIKAIENAVSTFVDF